jgi:hypothetical protein
MPHQVLGNKSIPTNTDSAASSEETRTEATVPEDVRPVRVHFPRPPPLPALLLDRNAPSKPQPLSDMDSQIQPSGLYLPPPPRWPPPEFEGLDTKIKLRRLERSLALENTELPDVLDDRWFEQKLQKLMDVKLELEKARLESQGVRMQDPPSLTPAQREEEMSDVNGCFVKPVGEYTKPFCDFLTENPTVFHAVDYFKRKLKANGFTEVCHIQDCSWLVYNLHTNPKP